ncbi:hypothetical protein CU015_1904 [Enterococcus faecium]|nr:hypothetical protein [Enterococcus faecium]
MFSTKRLLEHRESEVVKKSFSFEYEEKFCENGFPHFCINLA